MTPRSSWQPVFEFGVCPLNLQKTPSAAPPFLREAVTNAAKTSGAVFAALFAIPIRPIRQQSTAMSQSHAQSMLGRMPFPDSQAASAFGSCPRRPAAASSDSMTLQSTRFRALYSHSQLILKQH
jgi:hypothetical protein